MFKRCCAIVMTMILFMGYVFTSSIFVEAASDTIIQSGDWKYIVSADGTAALRKYCGTDEIVQVPSEIDNFHVTKLVDTFYENSYVTDVTIPDGVTSIESYAFYGCNRLQNISIPNTVRSVGNYAFYGCVSLKSIVLPEGVNSIGDYVFYDCYSMTNVSLPEGLKSIGHEAFIGCESLKTVIIPESVTSIGQGVFWNCSSLTNVSLPNNLTSIVRYLFVGCTSLVDITIPNNVTSIGSQAFDGCSSLTQITIPKAVIDIDYSAFAGCNNLESVHISDLKQWCQIDFGDTTSNPLSRGATLFLNGIKLDDIVIPEGIASVGNNVFTGYEDLKSITIPEGVTSIGENAFSLCTNLTSITIPDGATSIGNYAFGGCRRLQNISIPDSVTSIGRNAFANCVNLKSIVIPEGVKRIEAETFYACKSLRSVSISEGLTSIGEYAFLSCNSLESISIPNSVTSIEYSAFAGCSSLSEITIPTNLTCIEGCVFSTCRSLTDVTIPEQITSIGWHAFYACTNLTRIFIPNEVTYIDSYAFTDCEQLTIYGIADSCAQNHALVNNIPFVLDPLIQYDANGGIDAPSAEQPQRGENFKLSEQIPTREGYEFVGWSTEQNGAVEYHAGDIYENADNLILYAVWQKTYMVTYDANGGVGGPEKQIKYHGRILRITDATPTRDKYSFMGWSTEVDGEVSYIPSSDYNIDADIVLYAVWSENECQENAHVFSYNQGMTCEKCGFSKQPQVPQLKSKTFSSVTLVESENYEYSMDGETWQESNIFTGLSVNATYIFYQRIKESSSTQVSESSEGLVVYLKSPQDKPLVPIISSYTDIMVTLLPITNGEYSIDGTRWQTSNVFENLCPATRYTFYQRYAETDTHEVSESSSGTSVTTDKSEQALKPNAPTIQSITSSSITLTPVVGCEYSKNGTTWQTSNVFSGLSCGTEYTFYQRYKETLSTYVGQSSEGTTEKTDKGMQSVPFSPTLSNKTSNSVTLTNVNGYEYSMDGITWQISNMFTGLSPETNYLFYQRKAETDTHYASEASAYLIVKTAEEPTYIIGDLDGDFELSDWDGVMLARYLAGWQVEISVLESLDIDGDGEVSDWDGVVLDRYLAGWNIQIGGQSQ